MLRTLGGKNLGKCRLRAHQHPLLPPLPNLRRARAHANLQGKTRLQRVMKRVLGDMLEDMLEDVLEGCVLEGCVLKIGCFLHRFLISSPDLGIDARISLFKPSCVHRFLISGLDLRIDAAQSSWR